MIEIDLFDFLFMMALFIIGLKFEFVRLNNKIDNIRSNIESRTKI